MQLRDWFRPPRHVLTIFLDPDAALVTYQRLAAVADDIAVDGIPASLLASVGRATMLEGTDGGRLREQADALARDLLAGRWAISEAQHRFYITQAGKWGARLAEDRDAVA
jgi:hypothetical protein